MFSNNQLKILALLMSQQEKEYYMSEIGEVLEKKPGVFQRGLNSLVKEGIVVSRRKGNLRLFRINTDYPLFPEIRKIVEKTVGVEGLLRRMVEGMDKVEKAFIYGSYAKDSMRADSDIDLAVVGDGGIESELIRELKKIEELVDREINYRLYSRKEFAEKTTAKDAFLLEILSDEIIILKGDLNV